MSEMARVNAFKGLPLGWKSENVSNLTLEHKQGYYTKDDYVNNGTYLIRITDLKNLKIDFSEMPKVPIDEKTYKQFSVDSEDFLFARSGAIGRYGIYRDHYPKAIFASYLIRFKFDNKKILNEFFGYFYGSSYCLSQINAITQGSSNININANNIKALIVPVPPIKEQIKISSILTSVDEAFEKIEAIIEQTEKVKKGLMQQLLTKGIEHTKFKQTEIGEIPEEWTIKKVEEVCEILDGLRKPIKKADRHKIDGNIPYYGASGIIDWVNDFIFNEPLVLLAEDGENLRSRSLPIAFKIEGKTWVNNHAHVLRPQNIDIDFLELYLESLDYEKYITGSAQPKLNQKVTKSILIAYPPIEEQIKISKIISSFKDKVIVEKSKLIKLKTIKNGLMQVLLTGKVRVKLDE